jgi:hypothetical protein
MEVRLGKTILGEIGKTGKKSEAKSQSRKLISLLPCIYLYINLIL